MNGWIIALEISQIVIIVIIGLFIRSYLPAYFTKKGENLATKEDIGEITEQVEKIKMLYSAQMESTRSSIAEARLEKEECLREQKSCLLRFYDLAIELMYEKLAVNFGDLPMGQGKSLADFRNSFYELISNLIKSYQRIVAYFDHDDDLRVEAESVLTQALEAQRVFKKHFTKVTIAFLNESQAFMSCENMNASVEATNAANAQYGNAMHPVITEMQLSLRCYLTALNRFLCPNEQSQVPSAMFLADE